MHDWQFEYVEGQARPGFPALLAEYQQRSDQVATQPGNVLDQPYGPHARQRFDFFPASGPAAGVLLYFHAGYWQSRDKAQFRFLAPFFQARGLHFVAVNYPLCPEVSLAALMHAVLPSVPAVRSHLASHGLGGLPLVVAGHSAGGHLAAEIALAASAEGAGVQGVLGVLGISGVYNPEPLVATTLNQKLLLTEDSAAQANVLRRVRPGLPPGLWVVGGAETPAFLAQNAAMHAAWQGAGNASASVEVPEADHFTVLGALAPDHTGMGLAFDTWWQQVQAFAQTSA